VTLARYSAPIALGVAFAAVALAACSAIDPNPPDPHILHDALSVDHPDAAPDAPEEAP
jgi:hypothetical protein